MQHEKFHYADKAALDAELAKLGVKLPYSEDLKVLGDPVTFGGVTSANRFVIQPMEGCDGTADGSPDELTIRRYDRFAESGAGLIWAEACAVVPEGRANPRQLWLHEGNLEAYKVFVERIREKCQAKFGFNPVIILQCTHSGRYSKPEGTPAPMIAYNNPLFEKDKPIDASRIVTDEYLDTLPEYYAKAAKLAEAAGFDGVDIKACHRYLVSETLSGFNRPGRYGGSFENRTRLFRDAAAAAKSAVSAGFLVTSRMNVYDGFPRPYGFGISEADGKTPDLAEPIALIQYLQKELGYKLIDITIGNPYVNPHVNRPYDMGGYVPDEHPLEGEARMFDCVGAIKRACPELTVISSGHTYLRAFAPQLAAGCIAEGVSDMAGFGRMAFAYPEFAADILEKGKLDPKKLCMTCGKCTELMRAGKTPGCVLRDSLYTALYKETFLNK
ncbi:MAG: flavin oxidoreductase/NADH oxidase [Ruminococcaceae bacterium]|nr:flavin oxidoreductase/NADH oxidase [Oscillospiraceae bacterium]